MWSLILGLLPGAFSTINGITNAIANAKIAAITATTDQQRIAAQEQIATLEARRDVLISESHSPWNGLMRFLIALGPMVILNKILVWDKAFGDYTGGHTDALDANLWWVVTAVVGFYFVAEIARTLKS